MFIEDSVRKYKIVTLLGMVISKLAQLGLTPSLHNRLSIIFIKFKLSVKTWTVYTGSALNLMYCVDLD